MNKVKKSTSIIFYFQGSQFICENYITGKLTFLNPLVLQIINFAEDYKGFQELTDMFKNIPNVGDIILQLIDNDILIQENSHADSLENILDTWEWDLPARFFHSKTNYVNFEANNEEVWQKLDAKSKKKKPPSPYQVIPGLEYFKLLQPSQNLESNIFSALLERRTCRAFTREPILARELSDILYYVYGKTGEYNGGSLGDVIFKTSPSGGSRHHPEVFILVNNVTGIDKGIYHYNVKDHSLGLIEGGDMRKWGLEICSGQLWVEDASILFIVTSILKRNMWKYENSHAYRVINLDIGHLGQTFNLVCTALGLASFGTAALKNKLIEEKLDINPFIQPAFYISATGHPDKTNKEYARE